MSFPTHIGKRLRNIKIDKDIYMETMEISLGITHDELLEFKLGANMLSWI